MILYIVLLHQSQSTEVADQKTFLLAVRRMEVVLDKEIFQKIELMKILPKKQASDIKMGVKTKQKQTTNKTTRNPTNLST